MKKNLIHDDNYYYEIAKQNIKKYRKLNKLNQKELGTITGFSGKYISDIENKNINSQLPIPTLCTLAQALGTFPCKLLNNTLNINDFTIDENIKNNFKIQSKDYYYNIVRKNIIKIRIVNNLTQQDLADKIGVSREFISQIETTSKAFSLAVVGRIADALNLDICLLFE